jgi:hypothetical protein
MSLFEMWSPVTHDFGLIHASVDIVSARYLAWHLELGRRLEARSGSDFAASLGFLPPLSAEKRRCIFVSTRSGWTAFFQSGIQGSDPFPVMNHLTKLLDVDSMRICTTPPAAVHPACIWEVYAPESRGGVPPLLYRRAVSVASEDGRWSFHASGQPFPFEELAAYSVRRKRDRFTPSMLRQYLAHFDLFPFEDDFFSPPGSPPSALIECANRWDTPPADFTLEEVRAGLPWRRVAD